MNRDTAPTMEVSRQILHLWKAFLKTPLGLFLKERTKLVHNLSRGGRLANKSLTAVILIPSGITLFLALIYHSKILFCLSITMCVGLCVSCAWFWRSYKDSPQQDVDKLDTTPYLMSQAGVKQRLSGWKLSQDANTALKERREMLDANPDTRGTAISPRLLGIKIGECHGIDAWVTSERPVYVCGPTRGGKSTRIVAPLIVEAPGPVITTSSRKDIIDYTMEYRLKGFDTEKRTDCDGGHPSMNGGNVYIWDPTGIIENDSKLKKYKLNWDPVKLCIIPEKARSKAEELVSSAELSKENQVWAKIAVEIVQALLSAGAVSNKGLDSIYWWAQDMTGINTARQILESNEDPDIRKRAAPLISLANDRDPRSVSSKMLTVTAAFGALSTPKVREWFRPKPFEKQFDMETFLQGQNTVYLLSPLRSTAGQTETSVGGFSNMFLQEARDIARKLATDRKHGKLDPFLSLILDEVANTTPWKGLPQLVTAGTGEGIWTCLFGQARDLMRAAFGNGEERQMFDNSQKIILGGASTPETLKDVSTLTGEFTDQHRDHSYQWPTTPTRVLLRGSTMERSTRRSVLQPSEIRQIPQDRALLISASNPAAAIELIPYWERGWIARETDTSTKRTIPISESILR